MRKLPYNKQIAGTLSLVLPLPSSYWLYPVWFSLLTSPCQVCLLHIQLSPGPCPTPNDLFCRSVASDTVGSCFWCGPEYPQELAVQHSLEMKYILSDEAWLREWQRNIFNWLADGGIITITINLVTNKMWILMSFKWGFSETMFSLMHYTSLFCLLLFLFMISSSMPITTFWQAYKDTWTWQYISPLWYICTLLIWKHRYFRSGSPACWLTEKSRPSFNVTINSACTSAFDVCSYHKFMQKKILLTKWNDATSKEKPVDNFLSLSYSC